MNSHPQSLLHRVTKRLELLFKTDISYLARGVLHLSIGQVFATISGLLLTFFLVQLLDKADYGLYTYILALAGIAGSFTLAGMDTAVAQAVARGSEDVVRGGFWAKLRWALPAGIVTFGFGAYYIYKDNYTLGVSLIIIGLLSPLLSASTLYGAYFNGKKLFKKLAFDNAFKNASITAGILLAAFCTKNVIYIILAYFLTNTLISFVRYCILVQKIPASNDGEPKTTLSLGKHLSVMSCLANIPTHIDEILIFQFLGATPLALYALALAPIKQLQNISKITNVLILPKFSTRTVHELKKSVPHKTLIFFLVSVCLTICYWVLAPILFTYVFPKYHEAILYSQVLSLSLLFMPFILHLQALTTLERKKELYIFNMVKPIIKIVLLVTLAPLYGIWGAVVAFLGMHLVNSILLHILFKNISTE